MYKFFISFFLFFSIFLFAQNSKATKTLEAQLRQTNYLKNPKKGKVELELLSKKALKENNIEVYLSALNLINWCYLQYPDFNAALKSAMFSRNEAQKYNHVFKEAESMRYLAFAYNGLGLEKESLKTTHDALEKIQALEGDEFSMMRGDLYAALSEYYNQKKNRCRISEILKKSNLRISSNQKHPTPRKI